ncbi:F-box/kelch-repeat protein At1g57790-like isoform X3 [Actinidia eriantha]|uniref:F-box/kelch-repeat protein At1g57790-like isoform X3 n=1 Tax=Actinidia eriantha TaxID=165200 RepID=UPI00258B230A|nr:F-box/kelch-repeat protein At1g57790-like isoform X3 [Actinidia eriantha]XP_057502011.1 F-box/kelch-repeat protein At1g57790-like isoform X3 [Actinidia eriantha]
MDSSYMSNDKLQVVRIDIREGREKMCLCCLPMELLLIVLSYLSILDYLSFRAVCKCWRSAFSRCSPFISQNQTQRQLPWFMLLRFEELLEGPLKSPTKERLLQTTGKFGDLSSRHVYTTDIPDLCETQILLSRHGWLLLFSSKKGSSSLFFLNPFSRARIDIPLIDVTKFPVFDMSAPPTSPDCMLFAISCQDFDIKISTCRREESTWTTNLYTCCWRTTNVVNAVFVNGTWYCLHKCGDFSAFDAVNCCWRYLGLPEVFFEVLLKEPLKVTRDVSDFYWQFDVEHLIRTSPERAIMQLQNQLQIDSFNAHAWCGACDTKDGITFRWHLFRSCVNVQFCLDGRSCLRNNKDCSTIVMWMEPAWCHPSPALSWML